MHDLILFDHIKEWKVIYPGVRIFNTDEHIICVFHSSSEGDSTPVNRGIIDNFFLSLTDEERKKFLIFTCYPMSVINNYWNYLWVDKILGKEYNSIGHWKLTTSQKNKWLELSYRV